MKTKIGQMKESALHAALKEWFAQPGDQIEHLVDGYVVDILRGKQVFEIQTGSFSHLSAKLIRLTEQYDVTVIYPIPIERTVLRVDIHSGQQLSRRRSPKKGRTEEIFKELVYLIPVIKERVISFEIILVRDAISFVNDGKGSWRRKGWSIADRKLISVSGSEAIHTIAEFTRYLPAGLPEPFTARDVSRAGGFPIALARKMVYCLFHLGLIGRSGKSGNSWLYHTLEN